MSSQYMFDTVVIFILATIIGIGACTVVVGSAAQEVIQTLEDHYTSGVEI